MIRVDFNNVVGKMKPMHAVNNGPVGAREDQTRGNFGAFKELNIPFVRNHDASYQSAYGGEHTVDVHAIFPDFAKNPYDPNSYDFTLTDEYTKIIHDAGSEVFYRLGSKIEHWSKKYGTIVPADFQKWAVICEHIIRHYTEGWADGFYYKMPYWEVWNEPDGKKDNGDQPNWSGTPEEFYEFYIVAASHLKKRFPHLQIGGPAYTWMGDLRWLKGFLNAINEAKAKGIEVPLDFFSFHVYSDTIGPFGHHAWIARTTMDEAGFTETKIINNEWNYLENWGDKFIASIEAIIGMRGGAHTAAVMLDGQKSCIDMLMYYDARPSAFNGLFDFYTMRPLKAYYSFLYFSKLYNLENEVFNETDDKNIYVGAAAKDGKKAIMISHFADDKSPESKEVVLEVSDVEEWKCEIVDKDRTREELSVKQEKGKLYFTMPAESVVLITN